MPSALSQAAKKLGFESWDYSRAFKQEFRFRKVRTMLESGLTWKAIFARMPGIFARHEMMRQQFNKELYRRTHQEAETYMNSHDVMISLLSGGGWSTNRIAKQLGLSDRTVTRSRAKRLLLPSVAQIRTVIRDLRHLQLEDMGWEHSKNLLLGLFSHLPSNLRKPEVRAWVDVLDLFDETLEDLLDAS